MSKSFPVRILPSRIHPTLDDCAALFGSQKTDELRDKRIRTYRQTELAILLTGPAGEMRNVPVYLPFTEERSLVMLTITAARDLGLSAPVCIEPVDCASPGATVSSPDGSISLSSGVHIPRRRLLLSPKGATDPYLREGDMAFVAPVIAKMKPKKEGTRVLIFGEVEVKYSTDFEQGFYIDPEEAAAANLENGDPVRVVGKPTTPEFRSDRSINRKKRLISESDVRQAIMSKQTITIEPWMIVTPAARELGNSHKIFKYSR